VRIRSVVPFVFVALGVTLYTTGPLYRVRTWWSFDDPLADDPVIVTVYSAVALVGLGVLVHDGRWRRLPSSLVVTMAALVGWLLLTTAWSSDRVLTFRETLFVGGALVAGCAAATVLRLRALGWAIWTGLHAGLFWSFVALRTETPGTIDDDGEFAGVFFNRNSLALYAALGIVLGVVLGLDAAQKLVRDGQPVAAVGVGLAAGGLGVDLWLINGANAATPTVAAAIALAALVVALLARRFVRPPTSPRLVAAIGGAGALVLATVAWFTREPWLDAVGRDTDLTGRSDIWDVALDWAGRRPVHGYGYLGAWGDAAFVQEVDRATGHVLMSSHNAFIEALLGGGLIGLALLVALVAVVYLAVATRAVRGHSVLAAWPLAVFVFVLVENLTETLIVGNQLAVALLSATCVAASQRPSAPDLGVISLTGRSGRVPSHLLEGRTPRTS
jgi:exopolysaccharide production protein ExoQ